MILVETSDDFKKDVGKEKGVDTKKQKSKSEKTPQ